MKMAKAKIDFDNDIINIFGQDIKISFSASDHYFIPVSRKNQVTVDIAEDNTCGGSILLRIADISSKSHDENFKIVRKLHCQFGHANASKLQKLAAVVFKVILNMGEQFNITSKTTAPKSPWSNSMVERHNGILAKTIKKFILDSNSKYSIDVVIAWAVNAKTAFINVMVTAQTNQFLGITQVYHLFWLMIYQR